MHRMLPLLMVLVTAIVSFAGCQCQRDTPCCVELAAVPSPPAAATDAPQTESRQLRQLSDEEREAIARFEALQRRTHPGSVETRAKIQRMIDSIRYKD